MSENIIEQIARIEAEADAIVAEAQERSSRLEAGVPAEIQRLRQEHEQALKAKVRALEDELRQDLERQLKQLETKADEAAQRLQALDASAVRQASDLILRHLHGDGQWPLTG